MVSGGAITATKGALDNKVIVDIQMVTSINLTVMALPYAIDKRSFRAICKLT